MTRFMESRKYKSGWRWCLFRWTDVDPVGDGKTYLTRFHIFQTPYCSCMVHWLHLADPQPHLHDHPNDFLSVVLKGGYVEAFPASDNSDETIEKTVRRFNLVRATDRHKILSVKPHTITLVFANRVRREWGFWVNGELVKWRDYIKMYRDGSFKS